MDESGSRRVIRSTLGKQPAGKLFWATGSGVMDAFCVAWRTILLQTPHASTVDMCDSGEREIDSLHRWTCCGVQLAKIEGSVTG